MGSFTSTFPGPKLVSTAQQQVSSICTAPDLFCCHNASRPGVLLLFTDVLVFQSFKLENVMLLEGQMKALQEVSILCRSSELRMRARRLLRPPLTETTCCGMVRFEHTVLRCVYVSREVCQISKAGTREKMGPGLRKRVRALDLTSYKHYGLQDVGF